MNPQVKLRHWLPAALALLAVIMTIVDFSHDWIRAGSTVEELSLRRIIALGSVVAPHLEHYLNHEESESAADEISRLVVVPNLKNALVLDDRNRVIYATDPGVKGKDAASTSSAEAIPLFEPARQTRAAQPSISPDGRRLHVAFPFPMALLPGELRPSRTAILLLESDLTELKRTEHASIAKRSLMVGLITFLACFGIWAFFHRFYTNRLTQIASTLSSYTAGARPTGIQVTGDDELGQIGRTLNRMLDDLAAQNAALKSSERRLRTIIEAEPECVKLIGTDGCLVEMNPAGLAMLDAEKLEDITSVPLQNLIAPEHRQKFTELHDRAIKDGSSGTLEFETIGVKGTRRWMETHAVPMRDSGGSITGVLAVTRDVSERKRNEALLEGQRRILEMIAVGLPLERILSALLLLIESQSPDLLCSILLLDADGKHLRHGAAPSLPQDYVRAIEIVPVESIGGSCGTAAFRRTPVIAEDIATDPLWNKYRDLAIPHGLRSCWSTPIFDAHQQLLGTFAIYYRAPRRPSTRHEKLVEIATNTAAIAIIREREEKALRASEERFRELAETVNEVFWISTADKARLLYVSPACKTIWGRSPGQLVDDPEAWWQSIHSEDRERVNQAYRMAATAGASDITYRILQPNGETRWIRDKAFPVIDPDNSGKVLRIVGVAEDITERMRLEEQLRQAQKMEAIGQLAGGVAHDFNNILAAILGNVELAMAETSKDHDSWESLDGIKRASGRAKSLVQQILAFSRQQPPERRPMRIGPVATEAASLLRATMPASVQVVTVLDDKAPVVLADATQMHQLIVNLGTNAWHALENKPGRIEIHVKGVLIDEATAIQVAGLKPGSYSCVTVSDTGKGIEPAMIRRIFDPFFTTKQVGKGTGLGLSVVHGIVQNHDGAITVKSDPGSGTTFQAYFPAAEARRESAPTSEGPTARSERCAKVVLYLDDEESLVSLSARLLGRLGCKVHGFTRPEEALTSFSANPELFNLVITDLNMPGVTGLAMAEEFLKIRKDVPVLLCSGHVTDELKAQALKRGIREVLYKPASLEEFVSAIRNHAT